MKNFLRNETSGKHPRNTEYPATLPKIRKHHEHLVICPRQQFHLDRFPQNLDNLSEAQIERFHQDIMEER